VTNALPAPVQPPVAAVGDAVQQTAGTVDQTVTQVAGTVGQVTGGLGVGPRR
jgi:chitodextrinase